MTFIRFLAARLGPNQSGAPSFCHLIEPISGHLIFYRLIGAHCAPQKKEIISIRLLAAPKGVLSFVPIRFEIIIVLPCARLHVYILYIVVYFIFLFIIFFFAFFFFDPLADRPSFSVTIANLSMSLEFAYGYYCYRISNCFRSISQEPSAEKTDNCTKLN